MKIWLLIITFILVGITLEVLTTSITNFFKKRTLKLEGKSYLWMVPIYAVVPFIYLLVLNYLPANSIFIRALEYMVLFFILEFISGSIIKSIIKKCPWNYSKHKYNFKGIITLRYAPIWYLYGILGEVIYLFLIKI